MGTFQLSSFIIYNSMIQCYKKVISINSMPAGSLKNLIKKGKIEKISPFQQNSNCCMPTQCPLLILDPNNTSDYLCEENICELFSFLASNGYTIETQLTEMMKHKTRDLICFISGP